LDLSSGVVLGTYHAPYARDQVVQTTAGRESLLKTALTYFQTNGVDFSQFDSAGNGTIPYFIVIWTGPDNGWANFWWGYKTDWSDSTFTLNGKSLVTYSFQQQFSHSGSYSGIFDPRVVIHETGHALGLPDYYDYDTTVGPDGGVGGLDIMDSVWGDHNAFSKWVLDWITPTVVASGSQTVVLNSSGTYSDAVVIMPGATATNSANEFFIAQNRYRTGNDPATAVVGLQDGYTAKAYPTDGMLLWHVDATLDAAGTDWAYDNSYTAHKMLKLMQADGLDRIENSSATADAAMYYQPGGELGPLTTPSSRNYLGVDSGVDVSSISKSGTQMTATFSIDDPRVLPTLTVAKSGSGSGTVTSDLAGITCGSDCAESYLSGTTVTLTAAYAPGSKFTGWSGGGCSGTGSCVVSLSADTTVTATFNTTLILNEDFDPVVSTIPSGWTKVITTGAAGWWFNYSSYNTTGGTGGNALGATSGKSSNYDSELRTFAMDLTTYGSVGLEFKTSIQNANETADVDVSVNGASGPWTNVWEKVGTFTGPQTVDVDLTSVAAGHSNVMVRFHHYGTGLWWVLDDIKVMASITVVPPAAQTITFGALSGKTYGASPITLGATASSGLAVSYAVTGPATLSGSTLTITGAGQVTVTASQAGNSNYGAATSVAQSFAVTAAVLTVTANNASRAYGNSNPAFTYAITGYVNGDKQAVVSGTAAETTTATSTSPGGSYPISFSTKSLTAANYTFNYVNGTLTVSAAPTVVLTTTAKLAIVSGGYQATITVINSGTGPAANVQLNTATLGAALGTSLPKNLGTLAAAGGSATVTVSFPATAGNPGATVVEKYAGTYTGGSFSTSLRVVLPASAPAA
jgi:M6 family metalloprotease-like protein